METIETKKEELIDLLDQLMISTPAQTEAEKKRIYRAQTLYQATKQPATVFSQEELLEKFITLCGEVIKEEHGLRNLLPVANYYTEHSKKFPENVQLQLDSWFTSFSF